MTERELMTIKRDLQRRAKKKHLGKKRTGAYVFGTLRKIRGNPEVSTFADAGLKIVKEAGRVFKGAPEFIVAVPVDGTRRELWEIDPQGRGGLMRQGFNYSPASFMRSKREGSPYKSKGGFRRVPKMRDLPKYLRGNPACMRSLQANGGKMKTWKLGEYASGGIIQAKVSQNGSAVAIRVLDMYTKEVLAVRLFRWPLDRFNMEMYLNELTTSYYSNVILDWIASAAK